MKKYYKVVGSDYFDLHNHSIKYEVGKTITAPDYNNKDECGGGIHILYNLDDYHNIMNKWVIPCRILEVKIVGKKYVKIDDKKIKCHKIKVIKDVTNKDYKLNNGKYNIVYSGGCADVNNGGRAVVYSGGRAVVYSGGRVTIKHSRIAIFTDKKCYAFKNKDINKTFKYINDELVLEK